MRREYNIYIYDSRNFGKVPISLYVAFKYPLQGIRKIDLCGTCVKQKSSRVLAHEHV